MDIAATELGDYPILFLKDSKGVIPQSLYKLVRHNWYSWQQMNNIGDSPLNGSTGVGGHNYVTERSVRDMVLASPHPPVDPDDVNAQNSNNI